MSTKYTDADRDTGGRVYETNELSLVRRSWSWPDAERGQLARAHCSLEFASEDLATALRDFKDTGTRPGWVKAATKVLREVDRLVAAVNAELES